MTVPYSRASLYRGSKQRRDIAAQSSLCAYYAVVITTCAYCPSITWVVDQRLTDSFAATGLFVHSRARFVDCMGQE